MVFFLLSAYQELPIMSFLMPVLRAVCMDFYSGFQLFSVNVAQSSMTKKDIFVLCLTLALL